MNRDTLLLHLAEAEPHVARSNAQLARQEALVAALDRDGYDTSDARAVLEKMRAIQLVCLQDVARILRELKADPPP